MSHHYTSSKLKSITDHFRSCADNLLKNIDELNQENKEINVKPLMRCLCIDAISKFVFCVHVNSFKEK